MKQPWGIWVNIVFVGNNTLQSATGQSYGCPNASKLRGIWHKNPQRMDEKPKPKITAKPCSFYEIRYISRPMWLEMQCFTVQLTAVVTWSNMITAVTGAEYESEIEFIGDTPHLTVTGEVRYVFYEYFGWNLPCYNGTTRYMCISMPVR